MYTVFCYVPHKVNTFWKKERKKFWSSFRGLRFLPMFIYLFVCKQDTSKSYRQVLDTFFKERFIWLIIWIFMTFTGQSFFYNLPVIPWFCLLWCVTVCMKFNYIINRGSLDPNHSPHFKFASWTGSVLVWSVPPARANQTAFPPDNRGNLVFVQQVAVTRATTHL